MLQTRLNAIYTFNRRQVNISFAQSEDMPALRPEKAVFHLVFFLLMLCTMPVVTITLNSKHCINKGEIKRERTDDILCLRMHPYVLKSIFHLVLYAANTWHVLKYEDVATLFRAKAKSLYSVGFTLFQSAAHLALNCYSSKLAFLICPRTFVRAVDNISALLPIGIVGEQFTAMRARCRDWLVFGCIYVFQSTSMRTKLAVFAFVGEFFTTLFAGKGVRHNTNPFDSGYRHFVRRLVSKPALSVGDQPTLAASSIPFFARR